MTSDAANKSGAKRKTLEELLVQKMVRPLDSGDSTEEVERLRGENHTLRQQVTHLETENHHLHGDLKAYRKRIEAANSILFENGLNALKAGTFTVSGKWFQAVLILDPGHIKARLNLAVTHCEAGQTEQGIQAFKAVLAKDPENRIAQQNLAILTGE